MTNKMNFKKIFALVLLVLVSFISVSCDRDEPVNPHNEQEEKGHDNWTRVEIIVREGHLHGTLFHGNPSLVDVDPDDKVIFLPKEQRIIFEQSATGVVTRKRIDINAVEVEENGEKKIKMVEVERDPMHPIEVYTGEEEEDDDHGHSHAASGRYAMEIIYYNGDERINSQFLTPEQIDHHQHFFTAKEYTNWRTGQTFTSTRFFADELFKYTYRDTNPEDQMVATSKQGGSELSNNPVGLKGYFYFAKNEVKFNMNVRLAHLYISKKQNGEWAAANNPSAQLLLNGTSDFDQNIPFIVVGDNGHDTDGFVESLSKYYGVDEDTIYDYIFGKSTGGEESSNFWM